MKHTLTLLIAVMLVPSAILVAESPRNIAWQVLGGPEKEKGDAVQIVEGTGENLEVFVAGRRGTVLRRFTETSLPATLTFRFKSRYDPKAREVPTELFGTGDFRIFVGTRGGTKEKTELGGYEGFQFRLCPHLSDSPERVITGNESHTATSLWIRYIDPKRHQDGKGLPHTGLLSDAGQNRNKQKGIHNAGWARVALLKGGFGLKNKQEAAVTIRLAHQAMSIEANGKTFAYPFGPGECRISKIDTLAVAHTNTSRGYQAYRVSALEVSSNLEQESSTESSERKIFRTKQP
jgi:hypothetical protein